MRISYLVLALLLLAATTDLFANPCDEVVVPRQPARDLVALAECQQLAESGDAHSELQYGLLLIGGLLPDEYRNKPEGIRWIRKSAEKGNYMARVAMGGLLSRTWEDSINEFLDYIEAYA
jgi:hypothetical protein